jgi:hypothetical protein
MNPDAMISAASLINREWGSYGYSIEYAESLGCGSVLLKVCAADGGRFYVGSTRYGNTVHNEDYSAALAALHRQVLEDNKP